MTQFKALGSPFSAPRTNKSSNNERGGKIQVDSWVPCLLASVPKWGVGWIKEAVEADGEIAIDLHQVTSGERGAGVVLNVTATESPRSIWVYKGQAYVEGEIKCLDIEDPRPFPYPGTEKCSWKLALFSRNNLVSHMHMFKNGDKSR